MSFWSNGDVQRWLNASPYHDCIIKTFDNGRWGIYQAAKKLITYALTDDDPEEIFDTGDTLAVVHVGYQCVFKVENRLPGSWIIDEMYRRDPRLMHNPGNHYHQAFAASCEAEANHAREQEELRKSGLKAWETVKKSKSTMEAIAKRLEVGDTEGAAYELSLEGMCRRAMLANPKELRSKDFWKRVNG